ncbi:MAG: BTAD domain-containing putative transcriptional regulator [Actinomycetota bacterium]
MAPRVRVIGPLAVEEGDARLEGPGLGGARERRLLAVLAMAGGEALPKDVLAERLWDRPPVRHAAAVETAVSLLRRAVRPWGLDIETRHGGYRLACSSDWQELHGAMAAGRWDEALALAAGELLAGEPATEWVVRQRSELARARLDVTVKAAGTAAARGDDEAAALRFAAAVREAPLREDAHRGLMAALAHLGRPAEALRAYEHCRRALREELGTAPAPETDALYEQVLAGRPPTRPSSSPPAGRPGPPRGEVDAPLLGRRAQLGRLAAAIGAAAAGRGPRVVLVAGEPGIGKSRLVDEAVARAPVPEVRRAACFRLLAGVPYGALRDLAPELAPDLDAGPAPGVAPAAVAGRLAARWLEALAGRPVVVVVDDLGWADPPSLTALGLVLRARPSKLALLATGREADLAGEGAPTQFLELASGLGALERLDLGPLGADEVMAGGYAFELWERSGGHPLLLRELLAGAQDSDLAAGVLGRARTAGADAVELVRAAAVVGRPVPLGSLATLARITGAGARRAAGALADAGLMAEARGTWRVRHDVFADLVLGELDPPARRDWHSRAVEWLLTSEAGPEEVAHHALAAGDWPRALAASLDAGERAAAAYSNREAAGHYGRALAVLDEQPGATPDRPAVRHRAAVGRARALLVLGETEQAAATVASLPAGQGPAEVERLLVEADCHWAAWKPSLALAPARAALDLATSLGDDDLAGRAHAFIANPYGSLGELALASEHVAAALAVAERRGVAPPALVVYRLALVRHQRGEEPGALEALDWCRALATDQHDERALVFERVVRAWALGALGRYGEALAALDDVGSVGRGEEAVVRARVPNTRASLLFDLGLVEMALDADEESLEIACDQGGPAALEPRVHTLLNLAADHLRLGDPGRAATRLAEAEALVPEAEYARFRYLNRLHWARGLLALAGDDIETALAAAAETATMADRYGAPKYRARAHLLRGEALARLPAGARAGAEARSELRAGIRVAEGHGFAALAEHGHRLAAAATASAHHERRASQWRARMVASVDGPLRDRLH